MAHANARLGPAGRRELVRLICEMKWPERRAAECLSVRRRPRIAGSGAGWLASAEHRRSGAWARDRSSRPHRSPRRTSAQLEARVCAARERTGWGPRLIAGETGVAHSTVHAILRRHGCSRAPRAAREPFRRYEWPCPGDLLHMDVKRYPRFRRPGHARHRRPPSGAPATHQPARSRLLPRDRRRPLAPGLRRAARRREGRDRRRVRRARSGLVCRPRDRCPPADDRRRDDLPPQPRAARVAAPRTPSATSSRRPTHRAGTAKSSASTRRWNANGPRACATATAPPETARCHTGCATTTSADPTAHSAANHRSAALTTSQGTTTRRSKALRKRRRAGAAGCAR